MKQTLHYILFVFLFSSTSLSLKGQVVGKLYGMTYIGGNLTGSGYGVINQFDPLNNHDTATINFTGPNGMDPYGNFIQLNNGLLYGMTAYNTHRNTSGTIIQYNVETGKDSILFTLPSSGSLGADLFGTLCHATNDTLYGLATIGGTHGSGVLFSFNYHTGAYGVLVNFIGAATTGYQPTGSPIQANNGLLYYLTTASKSGYGALLSYNIATRTNTLCHNFAGSPNDGYYPRGTLLQVNDSMLYGLTIYGGTSDSGTLFSFNINTNIESVLVNFNKINGAYPQLSLMQASDSNLYGTTAFGGLRDSGTIFKYNIASNIETVVCSFGGSADTGGFSPYCDLIQASDGKLYGVTNGYAGHSGKNQWGTIFSYDIHSMTKKTLSYYNDTNGANPYGDLLEAMSVSVAIINNHCPNDSSGSLTMNVRGDKPPLTYLWSNGATTSSITNLKSGIYQGHVTDSRGITISVTDTLKPLPIVMAFNVSGACYDTNNGGVSVSAIGGTKPYTYLWSNGATTDTTSSLSTGTYTCTITDASGCAVHKTVFITEAGPLVIDSIVATEQTFPYNNGKITVYAKGGIPPGDTACYYYLWSNGAPDSATITGLDSGTYIVCVTSCYGCGSSCSDSAIVLSGIKNINKLGNIANVYPVPSTGLITLNLTGFGFENLAITDALGREVYKESLGSQMKNKAMQLDLSSEPNGVYILYVNSQQGVLTRKIIIQK